MPRCMLQMVVVSEPRLVAQLLHNTNLAKPTQPVMVHFRQVSLHLQPQILMTLSSCCSCTLTAHVHDQFAANHAAHESKWQS